MEQGCLEGLALVRSAVDQLEWALMQLPRRALTADEARVADEIDEIKAKAGELEDVFKRVREGRYKSLAVTSLEQSVMWIMKGLTE